MTGESISYNLKINHSICGNQTSTDNRDLIKEAKKIHLNRMKKYLLLLINKSQVIPHLRWKLFYLMVEDWSTDRA